MIIKKLYILLIFIMNMLAFGGCSLNKGEVGLNTIMVSPEFENSTTEIFNEVFDEVSFIALQTNEKCLVTKIKQLHIVSDNIFILDELQKTIFHFASDGTFINSIGSKGREPGELLNPEYFIVDANLRRIKVYDRWLKKISVFDFDGKLERENKVDIYFQSFYQHSSGHYWAFMTNDGNGLENEEELNFVKMHETGKRIENVYGVENFNIMFCNGAHLSMLGNQEKTSFVLPLHKKIYEFNGSIVTTKYTLDFQEGNVPQKYIKKLSGTARIKRKENQKIFDDIMLKYAVGYTQFHELNDWIYFEYFYKKQGRGVFYSKKDKKVYNFSKTPHDKDTWKTMFPICYGNGNSLYAAVHPIALRKLLQNKTSHYSEQRINSITNLLNDIKEDDNSIIIKYEMAKI